MNIRIYPALLIFLLINLQCTRTATTLKLNPGDPFGQSMIDSKFILIRGDMDAVAEGEKGTMILCPKGCFLDASGKVVTGEIRIEIAEAFSMEDMVLSNLTTTSAGKPLETGGMIYFNATSGGEQLKVNPDIPVRIEIPTPERKPGMMVWAGRRDEAGNMDWSNPKPLENYLTIIDIHNLDFLPKGFLNEVGQGMPFRNHKETTKELADSLYYSLSESNGSDLVKGLLENNVNEPLSSMLVKGDSLAVDTTAIDAPVKATCGIDPAIIKLMVTKEYQHTLIATREFEARVQEIYKTCSNDILGIYLRNLDKNLYELDSMAAAACNKIGKFKSNHRFDEFAQQRLTKVRDADKYALLLNAHYEASLAEVKSGLQKEKRKLDEMLQSRNKEAGKVVESYKVLLEKRESYRMETYGFTRTEMGWINIDNGTLPKSWEPQPVQATVANGNKVDRVYTYVIYLSIKSLVRLSGSDNLHFYAGNEQDKEMPGPKEDRAVAMAIGYKGEDVWMAVQEFVTDGVNNLSLDLQPSSKQKLSEILKKFDSYTAENTIDTDLAMMTKLYEEKKRQEMLERESDFIHRLWNIAFPCCNDLAVGEQLFYKNCIQCHSPGKDKVIGPGMASTPPRSEDWLYRWTTNAMALIKSGDKEANRIFNEYNKVVQPEMNLTRREVASIYSYLEKFKGK